MENTGYTILTRQSGLQREMAVIANNIANANTTGFRQEGLVFSEYVQKIDNQSSLSMATANISHSSNQQGTLTQTGGRFDVAIEGSGYFMIDTPSGQRLTRAGSFTPNADGDLVTPDGHMVMDAGNSSIFIPPDASDIQIGEDGTISVLGRPIGQLGVFVPIEGTKLIPEAGAMFRPNGETEAAQDTKVIQGFLENSNVDPISQMSRMIQVQRAYEAGQSFLDLENERVLNAIKTFVR